MRPADVFLLACLRVFFSLATRWQAFTHAAAQTTGSPGCSAAEIKCGAAELGDKTRISASQNCSVEIIFNLGAYFVFINTKQGKEYGRIKGVVCKI